MTTETASLFENLRRDYGRYEVTRATRLWTLLFQPGAWAITSYRFERWTRLARMPALARLPLRLVSKLLRLFVEAVTHIELSWQAQIGPGLYLPHAGSILVNPAVVMGENVTIAPNAVIGPSFERTDRPAAPTLGDRVYVAPGAKVIGAVEIGEDALIGPNAVVMKPVAARGVVMGNPGRTVGRSGCFHVVAYPGMESDPARQKSLAEAGLDDAGAPSSAAAEAGPATPTSG